MLYYQTAGSEATIISGAEQIVPLNTAFDIVCRVEEGYTWSYQRPAGNSWDLTPTSEGLSFSGIPSAESATFTFTVMAEDNEAFFYSITITAKD